MSSGILSLSSGLICSCMNLLQKSVATRTLGRERSTVQEMRRSQRQFTLLLLFHFKAHGLSQCQGCCTVLNLQLYPGSALKCKKQDRKDICKEVQSVIRKWRRRVTSPDQVVQEASSRTGNWTLGLWVLVGALTTELQFPSLKTRSRAMQKPTHMPSLLVKCGSFQRGQMDTQGQMLFINIISCCNAEMIIFLFSFSFFFFHWNCQFNVWWKALSLLRSTLHLWEVHVQAPQIITCEQTPAVRLSVQITAYTSPWP